MREGGGRWGERCRLKGSGKSCLLFWSFLGSGVRQRGEILMLNGRGRLLSCDGSLEEGQ